MASQSEPITTTDVLDYTGTMFFIGQKFGKSPTLSRAGMTTGYKVATASTFPMGVDVQGDSPAQDGVTEDNSIGSGTNTSYTASQTSNTLQLFQKFYIASYAREALQGSISGVAVAGMPMANIATLGVQRLAHMKQAMADFEYSALNGTEQAWTNAGTAGKMEGVITAIEAGSETAAGGATLSKSLIQTEVKRMAAAGAEFGDMAVVCGAHQYHVINDLYGNPEPNDMVGGVAITRIHIPLLGNAQILYDPIVPDDDVVFLDFNHYIPVFAIVPEKGVPIFTEPLARVTGGRREMLYFIASIDYSNVAFHGMISGLATS